ncbi:hypothetical protein [Aeromonas veronii]|uniref:hypothetical protein n=1 Tax=Aeromonas veronii TaxID=654 RepID=UPI00330AA833|nr:hypothetical protein [Aeromonas veronii]
MNHLESLAREWLEWNGNLVRANIMVGKRPAGGHEMEVDVVAYDPKAGVIKHYELSLDAQSWEKRRIRFEKKFHAARRYMFDEIFPFLPEGTPIQQFAVLPNNGQAEIAGGKVISVDDFVGIIAREVMAERKASRAAIHEQYPLLRQTQFLLCGYNKAPDLTIKPECL